MFTSIALKTIMGVIRCRPRTGNLQGWPQKEWITLRTVLSIDARLFVISFPVSAARFLVAAILGSVAVK